MNSASPRVNQAIIPLQPSLRRFRGYKAKIIKWNPYALKSSALCYQFETGEKEELSNFIPDGCPDFFFCCNKNRPGGIVKGIQKVPRTAILIPNSLYFGFKPYSTKGMREFSISWSELADTQIPLKDLVEENGVVEKIAAARNFEERIDIILNFAADTLVDENYRPDFVEYTSLHICNKQGKDIKIKEISSYTGYSARYCLEKFKESHGISIKSYANIMRFQNVVRMLSCKNNDELLSDIVFENGYFDQSHLNREFRRYTNNTPLSFKHKVLDGNPTTA